jgi:Hemolysins and related proteins containing CBS domains
MVALFEKQISRFESCNKPRYKAYFKETSLSSIVVEIVLIFVLILANGFFAASEIAIVSSRKGRLQQMAEHGDKGAQSALALVENPSRFLSAVQVGITLVGTLAAAFGGARIGNVLAEVFVKIPFIAPYATPLALGIVVLTISYLSLIVGELVPKRLALQGAEGVARFVAPTMTWISRLAAPVISFLTLSTNLVLQLLGRNKPADESVTEDDVLAMVRAGAEEGSLESAEETMIGRVFRFTDRTVLDVMTPRTEVVALSVDTPLAEAIHVVADSGYSRIPVYEESLDNVVGILHARDLLRSTVAPETMYEIDRGSPEATSSEQGTVSGNTATELSLPKVSLRDLVRPPVMLLESQRAVPAFQQLKQRQVHMAIVIDEYGQVSGLVTLEDFLEELVGEIDDEYDEASQQIVKREDGSYLVDGLLSFDDAQRVLELPELSEQLEEIGFNTVAGFVLALLDRLPVVGDKIEWEGYTIEVVDMDGMRIDKVLIQPPQNQDETLADSVLDAS